MNPGSPETNRVSESRKVSCDGAAGEIWLAYLQLVSVKHRAKSPELFCALDAATRAVLEALRETEAMKSRSQPAA